MAGGKECYGAVAGDGVATGAPESRKPPLWMKSGDVLEVEISGIGVLRTKIVDER